MKNEVDKNKLIRKIKEFVVFHCEHLFGTSGQETHHTIAHHTTQHKHTSQTAHRRRVFYRNLQHYHVKSTIDQLRYIQYYIARFQLKSVQFKSNQFKSNQIKSITENAHEITEKRTTPFPLKKKKPKPP